VRLTKHLWLDAGYGITIMGDVAANPSAFDPTAATVCTDAGGNLTNQACTARLAGQARPTAAGTYGRFVQDLGFSLAFKF
jgi:hypothetical protein